MRNLKRAGLYLVLVASLAVAGSGTEIESTGQRAGVAGAGVGNPVADPTSGRVYWTNRESIVAQDGATRRLVGSVRARRVSGLAVDVPRDRVFGAQRSGVVVVVRGSTLERLVVSYAPVNYSGYPAPVWESRVTKVQGSGQQIVGESGGRTNP